MNWGATRFTCRTTRTDQDFWPVATIALLGGNGNAGRGLWPPAAGGGANATRPGL